MRNSSDERVPQDQALGAMPDIAAAVVRSRCSKHPSSVDRSTDSRATFRSRYRSGARNSRSLFNLACGNDPHGRGRQGNSSCLPKCTSRRTGKTGVVTRVKAIGRRWPRFIRRWYSLSLVRARRRAGPAQRKSISQNRLFIHRVRWRIPRERGILVAARRRHGHDVRTDRSNADTLRGLPSTVWVQSYRRENGFSQLRMVRIQLARLHSSARQLPSAAGSRLCVTAT
jgi:hypothetical protein